MNKLKLKINLSRKEIELRNKKLYFNIDNSSEQFKSIFNRYQDSQKNIKQRIKFNMLNIFDQEKRKVEDKESEEVFMFKDFMHLRKMNEESAKEYGKKSNEILHDVNNTKFRIKMPKNYFVKFFNDIQKNDVLKTNQNKEISLPSILNNSETISESNLRKTQPSFLTEKKKNKKKLKFHSYIDFNQKNKKLKKTESSLFSIRINKKKINELNNTEINKNQQFDSTENSNDNPNFSLNNHSINCPNMKKSIYKRNWNLNSIENVKKDCIKKEKNFRYLFLRYDNHFNVSHEKYNFIYQKYFS